MKRFPILSTAVLVALAACSGGKTSSNNAASSKPASQPAAQKPAAQQPAAAQAPAAATAPLTTPKWFKYDKANNTVDMTVTAGLTDAKNYWNFNGGHDGDMIITVPVNAKVTIDFKNADKNMAHTLGIVAQTSGFSATPTNPPVFAGAQTTPHSATAGIDPGKSQILHFTASKAGRYAMICYMAGHAATGMWIYFDVSASGQAGVQTAGS